MGKVIGCSRHVDAGMCTLQHGDSMGNVALFAGAIFFEFLTQHHGLGCGVGRGLGVGIALGVAVGVTLGVGLGVAVGVTLGVGLGVAVGVADGVGVGVGLPWQLSNQLPAFTTTFPQSPLCIATVPT